MRRKMKHSSRLRCPKCGRDGKIRKKKTHVVFICTCGICLQAIEPFELRRKLRRLLHGEAE